MNLSKLLPLCGTPEFEDQLLDALNGDHSECFCDIAPSENGGYPSDAEVSIDEVDEEKDEVIVRLSVRYTENTAMGCENSVREDTGFMDCILTISRETGHADLELVDSGPCEEF